MLRSVQMSARMLMRQHFTDATRYFMKQDTLMILIFAIAFLPLYMSFAARFLYPASVALFLDRWSDKNLFLRSFLQFYWLGPSIPTAYGAGLRSKAGIKEPLWIDLAMLALLALYAVVCVKIA
jgi:hypothetical protein